MQHLLFLCKKIKLQNPAGFNVCSERFGAKHSYETQPSSKFPSGVNLSTTTLPIHLSSTTPLLGEFPKLSRSLKRMIWKWQLFQKLLMGKHVWDSWVNFLFTDRDFNWKSSKGCARSGFKFYHRIQTRPKTPRQLVPQRQPSQPQPAPPSQQQASSDFFKDTLFSQPIEIPSNSNGASFSYEAILG